MRPYNLIISSSSAYGKGIIPPPGATHICYCHTPMRFAWQTDAYVARERIGGMRRRVMQPMLAALRAWDVASSARVTHFIANSKVVAERINTHYGRSATIIPPPVDLAPFQPRPAGDYYLTGGRLVPYKRIDLAIQACTALNLPLVVFGDGRDKTELMAMAGPTVRFVGRISEQERLDLYAGCKAFLFPGEEDFGITPLEAMASGLPVIGTLTGGSAELLRHGQNALTYHAGNAAELAARITTLATDPTLRATLACTGQLEVRASLNLNLITSEIEAYLSDSLASWQAPTLPTYHAP
jgi:glycosyltransferase involved in cell wall biosynthesis